MNRLERLPISIVVPTYRRESILVDTVTRLLELDPPAAECLVLDQSPVHEPATETVLSALATRGEIQWLRLAMASIPAAMNRGLLEAREPCVLFVDDDVEPRRDLAQAHFQAHNEIGSPVLVAGRIWQPWQQRGTGAADEEMPPFTWAGAREVTEFMGGNFSVDRRAAVRCGGFDENFVGVAYRFEREFAERWRAAGHRIWYRPEAELVHLKAAAGGTRTYGEHLRTSGPEHSVGQYYYLLRSREVRWRGVEILRRWISAVLTRHHLRHPWWIPVSLVAETRGAALALRLARRGPRLLLPREPRGDGATE